MNLNQPIKAEKTTEEKDVLKTVDEDRKYVIQATIVRIMKARKVRRRAGMEAHARADECVRTCRR